MNKLLVSVWMYLFCFINLLFGQNIPTTKHCDTQYQLTDNYGNLRFNVSITQEECGQEQYNFTPSQVLIPGHFKLSIERNNVDRTLSLEWDFKEYFVDHVDYFIRASFMFDNRYIFEAENQHCQHVRVTSISNVGLPVNKLHINCLRVPLDRVGVVHVHSHRLMSKQDSTVSETTHDVFNIGCSFSKTTVTLGGEGEYFYVTFQHLPYDTDLKSSTVQISGPQQWNSFVDLTHSYSNGPTERFMHLDVNVSGKYDVKVELVCNTHGEINRTHFKFGMIVPSDSLGPFSQPANDTHPETHTKSPGDRKDLAWILVLVACVFGFIIAIVGSYSYHLWRRRSEVSRSGQPMNNTDSCSVPLQLPT
ncbi:hypothetical protein ACF0H5_014544 [Mactra antiquata]